MRELTPQQEQCEQAMAAALQGIGARLVNRRMEGKSETYVMAQVEGTDLTVYVYENGEGQIRGPSVDDRFEAADFGSVPEMVAAIARRLVERVQDRRRGPWRRP